MSKWLVIVAGLFLFGCSDIDPIDREAFRYCKCNKGISRLDIKGEHIKLKCKNGKYISGDFSFLKIHARYACDKGVCK